MEAAEIISLISLCFTIVFALPPFCKLIYDCLRNRIYFHIVGCEFYEQQLASLSLHIMNMSKAPFSITKIDINGTSTVVKEGHNYRSPIGSFINALDNKLFVIGCPEIKMEDQINILIYTTKRYRPYKKRINSLAEFLQEK